MSQRIDTLVILGAGGDLAARLLLPGLASFLATHQGDDLTVIGVDRDARTDAEWRAIVLGAFQTEPSPAAEIRRGCS